MTSPAQVQSLVQNVQQQMHFVVIDIQFPGFSTKASAEDYGSNVTLDIAMDTGTIKLVDPKELNPFLSNRRHVRNVLQREGVQLVPGALYLIPDSKVIAINRFLEEAHKKMLDDREILRQSFEATKEKWMEQNPNIKQKIETLCPTWSAVESRFMFEVTIFPMGEQRFGELGDGGLTQKMETASSTAISSICQIAAQYSPKEGVHARFAIERLESMAQKAQELSHVDPTGRLPLLAEYIDALIDKLPREGRLDGHSHLQVTSALAFMGSEKQVTQWLNTRVPTSTVLDRLVALTETSEVSTQTDDYSAMLGLGNEYQDMPPQEATPNPADQSQSLEDDFSRMI